MTSPLGITSAFALKAINDHWDSIVNIVPPDLLPIDITLPDRDPQKRRRYKRVFHEFGCGHYGCVFPTQRENVVLKATTDPTEATFVKAALSIGEFPEGIVTYFNILELPQTHRKRGVFLIWREEAFDVGQWRIPRDRNNINVQDRLIQFREHAKALKELLRKSKKDGSIIANARKLDEWASKLYDVEMISRLYSEMTFATTPYAVAARLRACKIIAEQMANEPLGYLIGRAFQFYLDKGIVLADVHSQNIGYVQREDHGGLVLAITDPGHAVFV